MTETMTDTDEWINQIHQGDATETLAELPDESVHAVVTDPPYGFEFTGKSEEHGVGFSGAAEFGGGDYADGGDRDLPKGYTNAENTKCRNCGCWRISSNPCECDEPDHPNVELKQKRAYQEWCEEWLTECLRVLKPNGHLLAFSNNRMHHRLFTAAEEAGLHVRDTITWHYASGFPSGRDLGQDGHEGWHTTLKPTTEFVLVARKPSHLPVIETMDQYGTGALNLDAFEIDKHPSNLFVGEDTERWLGETPRFYYCSRASRDRVDEDHPTVKPAELTKRLVYLVTSEGQTVLDPFAGSGTTCKAAKKLGRGFVGIELKPEYVAMGQAKSGIDVDQPELLSGSDQSLASFSGGGE